MPPRMTSVRLDHVSKIFGSQTALSDIDLTIEGGEIFFLLGPSGCGKTTLLRMIAGLHGPTTGRIFFNGKDVTNLGTEQRNAVMCFQSYALWPHMNARQNIRFGLEVRKVPSAEADARVEEAIRLVQLQKYANKKPNEMSGGQQQRVALARALVFEPRVVLMDEPLSALDKHLREEMQLEIRRLHRELGVTMVFVTHDQTEAMTLSDRVAVFNHGRIEQLASPQQLYDTPSNPFVAGFVGDNNMLGGRAEGDAALRTTDGSCLLARRVGSATAGAMATLCVRPEHLRVAGDGDSANRLQATLIDAIHQGDHWRLVVRLRCADTTWFAKLAPGALPRGVAPGQDLPLAFDRENAWLFAA